MELITKRNRTHNPKMIRVTLAGIRRRLQYSRKVLLRGLSLLRMKGKRKILYALTPPPYLKNVGDHAQVVAIRRWMDKHYPGFSVVEVDKDESALYLPLLQFILDPQDLIILHSGGNLGDRGIWSESRRRLLIRAFPNNQIVSLPQTIFFSDTPNGRQERENTKRIYADHARLTVIGRDQESGRLAEELFPRATVFCMPDFVLSLSPKPVRPPGDPLKLLLCLRLDNESTLNEEQRNQFQASLPYETIRYDTTLASPIHHREAIVEETLELFHSADLVVTDRYHGLIFSILCKKPTVVLPTVDHKLTSAIEWFKEVEFVVFANSLDDVPAALERVSRVQSRSTPDWNKLYFDKLPAMISSLSVPPAVHDPHSAI